MILVKQSTVTIYSQKFTLSSKIFEKVDFLCCTLCMGNYLPNSFEERVLREDIMKKNELKKKYELIYDEACNYLDNEFSKNICDFENDKCGEKRNTKSCVGCCKKYKNKLLGPFAFHDNWKICEYLEGKKCLVKNIGCKLFTCNYLHTKGIKFKIKDIPMLQEFNIIQKIIIRANVQVPKEEVIKRLLLWRSRNLYLFLSIFVVVLLCKIL